MRAHLLPQIVPLKPEVYPNSGSNVTEKAHHLRYEDHPVYVV